MSETARDDLWPLKIIAALVLVAAWAQVAHVYDARLDALADRPDAEPVVLEPLAAGWGSSDYIVIGGNDTLTNSAGLSITSATSSTLWLYDEDEPETGEREQ